MPTSAATAATAASTPDRLRAALVEASDAAIFVTGPDGRIVDVNPGLTRLLGYAREELLGSRPAERLCGTEADARALARTLAWTLADGAVAGGPDDGEASSAPSAGLKLDLLVRCRDTRPMWVSVVANALPGPADLAGRNAHAVVVMTDITRTKLHEVLQHKVLDAVVHDMPLREVMTLLCSEVERLAPEVVATVLAVDAQGLLRPLAAPSLPDEVSDAYDGLPIGPQVGSCGTAAWRREPVLVTDIAADPLWADYRALVLPLGLAACWSSPILGSHGDVLGTFAFYYRERRAPSPMHEQLVRVSTDLCALLLERERTAADVQALTLHDPVTGLPNRTRFTAIAASVLTDPRRGDEPIALLVIDLDRFRHVNETQGHRVGDGLLRQLANRLQQGTRELDLVGRLAGSEYVVLLPQCPAGLAGTTAGRLIGLLTRPLDVAGAWLHPSVTVGIAMHPEDGRDVESLLQHASLALNRAKGEARGGFRFYSPEMNRAARERAMLEADLRHALADGGLELHYQPQLGTDAAQTLHGVEALARWRHPQLGMVPPARFVSLAEESDLIGLLGRWVLEQACRQVADWRREGVDTGRVSVNLSPRDFDDAALPGIVAGALERHGLSPALLTLELTESVMLNPGPDAMAAIAAVRASGVQLAMDDFGTGYSSLSLLHRLPVGELKLDKTFVHDIEHSASARALTVSVLRIAESLGMTVVAEGVETEAQRHFLAERGCPVVQGYLLARPMPADALVRWVLERAVADAAEP